MSITLWILGCLAYTVVILACGAAMGFVWFGRGKWTYFLDKQIPARPVEFVDVQIRECVRAGIFTAEQGRKFTQKLWTDEVNADVKARWAEQQRTAVLEDRQRLERDEMDKLRRDLAAG